MPTTNPMNLERAIVGLYDAWDGCLDLLHEHGPGCPCLSCYIAGGLLFTLEMCVHAMDGNAPPTPVVLQRRQRFRQRAAERQADRDRRRGGRATSRRLRRKKPR